MNISGEVKKLDPNGKYGYLKTSNTIDIKFTSEHTQIEGMSFNQISLGDRFEIEYEKNAKGNLEATKILFKGKSQVSNLRNNPRQDEPSPSKDNNHNKDKYGYYVPSDTKKLINQNEVENYLLKLQKFATSEKPNADKEKFTFYKNEKENIKEVTPNYTQAIFKSITARHHSNAKSLLGEENIKDVNLKTDWRMALGLGNESVYETSITLHHIYGIPYIPASAIKGVVRSWIITNCFADTNNEKDFPLVNAEFRALTNSKIFCHIFGCPKDIQKIKFDNGKPVFKKDKNGNLTKEYEKEKSISVALKDQNGKGQEHQGKIIFFDAFPTDLKNESIKVDIMNPHYSKYYNDSNYKEYPTDTDNPNPIHFLTVENTSFQYIVGIKNNSAKVLDYPGYEKLKPADYESEKFKTLSLLDLANLWLKLALTEHGIGAKTAVGYGYMK